MNATFGYDEKTAVFFANHISWKAIQWLVEQGADINARNKWGLTSLHDIIIFAGGRLSTVELLFELSADIHAVTLDGNTLLHEAAMWGRLLIAKMLIERGTVMDAQNNKGENSMEYMLSNANNSNICKNLPVAEYFLSIGMTVTDQAVQSVKKLSKSFVFRTILYSCTAYKIREIVHGEKTLCPEKLCEYSVHWIQKNPDPIKLRIIFYIP